MLINVFLAVFAFYVIKSGISLQSADLASVLFRSTEMDVNFKCSRKKLSAIINVVLCEKAIQRVKDDLIEASTIAIHFDTTTLHNTKIITIMAKYYLPLMGPQVRCLDVRSIITETAENICEYIMEVIENANLDVNKTKILCADNTNTNFGGFTQAGINNVANKFQEEVNHGIIRNGCLGHILNNAFSLVGKNLKKDFKFDLSDALNRPFFFFYQKVKIRESFQLFCLSKGLRTENIYPLRKYGKTRWLSAFISLENMKKMYGTLTAYFLYEEEKNRSLPEAKRSSDITSNNAFFSKATNHVWILLLHKFSWDFYHISVSMQGRHASLISGLAQIDKLIQTLKMGNRYLVD